MKSHTKLLAIVVSTFPLLAPANEEPPSAIHEIQLDERRVVSVPVAMGRVTTVSFPGPIAAIDAALIATDEKTQGLFQLAHQPGSAFFSVRSLGKDAISNVNVRFNDKTYVLELKDSAAPVLSLVFRPPPDPRLTAARRQAPITPSALLGILDLAKAYPALKEANSEVVRQITHKEFREKPPVMEHADFQILIEEVFRFDAQDTLVFRVTLKNKTSKEVHYNPGSFNLRVGENRFSSSIADAGGVISVGKDAVAWFAVTGTPTGGRNELSVENDFVITLQTKESQEPTSIPPHEKGGSK